MSYTNIFGGYNINTAFPSYMSYQFSVDLQLTWASSFVDNNNVTAQNNDLDALFDGLTVTLADATMISVGQQIQFNNIGSYPITINNFMGGEIAVIPMTDANQVILYLQNNTLSSGVWGVTQLGSGESNVNATELSGLGTIPLNSQINTNFLGKQINSNYTVLASDRGSILIWTGGTNTITLPPILSLPVQGGFYIAINNQGSGSVTISPNAGDSTIDGNASFILNPGQSSYIINVLGNSGLNWNSLGYGIRPLNSLQTFSVNLFPYSGTHLNLTSTDSASVIQTFTATPNLTGNVTVFYPAATGQWYINNLAEGANIYIQLGNNTAPVGSPVEIPPGQRLIVYSDGTTMYYTPTVQTDVIFGDGSVGGPSITFESDSTTGFYYLGGGTTGYSSSGTETLTLTGSANPYGLVTISGRGVGFNNTTNTNIVGLTAPTALATNFTLSLPSADASITGQILQATTHVGGSLLNFSTASYPSTTVANELLYSSATNTIGSLATANNATLITSNTGIPSLSSTLPVAVQGNITSLGTILTGVWNGTPITPLYGGTGRTSVTPYTVICGGTTSTGNFQNVINVGSFGTVLTSNGIGALPTWQAALTITAATQADQVAGTSSTTYVSPATQQFHKSACKAWAVFAGSTGIINFSYGISSVVRISAGTYRITFSIPFTSTIYASNVTAETTLSLAAVVDNSFLSTTTQIQVRVRQTTTGVSTDPDYVNCSFFGVQ